MKLAGTTPYDRAWRAYQKARRDHPGTPLVEQRAADLLRAATK